MNREIKFRAWDKINNKMRLIKSIFYADDGFAGTVMTYLVGGDSYGYVHGESCDLMQYTGLKDENGTEIYEGDIVVYDDYNGRICWSEDKAMFELEYDDNIVTDFDHIYSKELEVIGNIYENPELLEVKNE